MFKWELINDHTEERQILSTDPHGWEDISLEHNRSERYDGMFLDFSRDLSFHCKGGGKEMLDEIFNEYGSEGQATLIIYFSCDGRFKKLAETFVHFPTYREEYKGKTLHTTVEVRKKGITQTVMSRDDTDVDLLSETSIGGVALNHYDYAPYDLTLHSRIIYIESDWDLESHSNCFRVVTPGLKELYAVPNATVNLKDIEQSSDISSQSAITNVFNGFMGTAPVIVNMSDNQIVTEENTFTVEWNISGSMTWNTFDVSFPPVGCEGETCGTGATNTKLIDSINMRLRLFYGDPEGDVAEACAGQGADGNLSYIDLISAPQYALTSVPFVKAFSNTGSQTFVLQPGARLWMHWVIDINYISSDGDITIDFTYSDKNVKIYSNTQSSPTVVKGIAIHEAWSRLCESVTDQTLAFKSAFFGRKNSQGLNYSKNGYASYTAILDGLRIRGFSKNSVNPILKGGQTKKGVITRVKDMYDSCNAVWGVGLGVETHEDTEVVRVEEKDYFYSDTEAYRIANIPNMEMHFAEEMAYSEIQLGYEKWKIQSKGGLDEPNTLARWVFPKIKNIKNVKELTSPYVAGMYAIEETRRKTGRITEDSDYDDEIFFIALKRSRPDQTPTELHLAEKNENITITQDTLLAPETAYNLRFNLFSNFDRVMNQFTTNLTKDTPQQINYSYLEGNGQMEFDYQDTLVWPHAGDLNGLKSQNVQNTETPNGRHRRQYPLFIPEVYTFSFPVPFSDYITLIENPYGYISFSSTDKNFKQGYIKKLSYNIAKQMAEFTLIRKFQW